MTQHTNSSRHQLKNTNNQLCPLQHPPCRVSLKASGSTRHTFSSRTSVGLRPQKSPRPSPSPTDTPARHLNLPVHHRRSQPPTILSAVRSLPPGAAVLPVEVGTAPVAVPARPAAGRLRGDKCRSTGNSWARGGGSASVGCGCCAGRVPALQGSCAVSVALSHYDPERFCLRKSRVESRCLLRGHNYMCAEPGLALGGLVPGFSQV